nr:hypothetical protein [Tanacetum cinerariifolium]
KDYAKTVKNQSNRAISDTRLEVYIKSRIKGHFSTMIKQMKPNVKKEDTNPSVDTSLNHEKDDQEIDEPQSDINPIRRSTRTRHPTDRLCLYIDAEEHELGDLGEHANYKAALLDPESKKWLDAMNVEMQSMKDNDVWVLAELPPNARTVGSKWLFKKKTEMDGAVYVFKARLVAKGFTQTYGVDYEETFSPVADIIAIRILIAMAMGNNIPMLQDVKSHLGRSFAMKDLGDAAYILGIKIYRDRSKRLIGLCQSAYIEKILKRYYMENSKRGTIPMQKKLKLSKSQSASTPVEKQRMQNIPYASAIGSIMYVVRCTRPDVAFAENMTSRFQQNPGEEHWTAVKNILKYLRNTKDMFLTGYVFVLNEGAVDWKSTKQIIFAILSMDAEYIVAFDASKEVVWIRKFIFGLGIVPTIEEPISMYCDKTGAIAIAKDDGVTKGASHFHAKVYYLREIIKLGDVKIEKIDTYDNLADPFTKALAFPKHPEQSAPSLFLSQSKFSKEILERAHMQNCNPFRTPVDIESKLSSDGDLVNDPTLYPSLAGALQYLTFTRPDLTYVVQQVCLYMHDPRDPHFTALKRILRYVCGTLDYALQLHISTTTQLSAAEAEYRGVVNVGAETAWIRNLLCELHTPLFTATLVYCDNVSAVYTSVNTVQHQRTKHIETDIHFVRDFVASEQVRVLHIPSRFQYANIFTMGLPTALLIEFRSSLNVRRSTAHTEGEY